MTAPSAQRHLHHCSFRSEKNQRTGDKFFTLLKKVCCQLSPFSHTLVRRAVVRFADAHDAGLWRCICRLLNIPEDQDAVTKLIATMPLVLGGLGLWSAARTRQAAFWASWADCLPMIRERHPELAEDLLLRLEGGANTSALGAAREAAFTLTGVMGFTPLSWTVLSRGARPPEWQPEDFEPGAQRRGWQHEAFFSSGAVVSRSSRVPPSARVRACPGEVSERHWQRRGPLGVTQQHFHPHRAATLPRSLVATPSNLPSLLTTLLSVWPLT